MDSRAVIHVIKLATSSSQRFSSLDTWTTGGPNGRRNFSALLGHKPGRAPRVSASTPCTSPIRSRRIGASRLRWINRLQASSSGSVPRPFS